MVQLFKQPFKRSLTTEKTTNAAWRTKPTLAPIRFAMKRSRSGLTYGRFCSVPRHSMMMLSVFTGITGCGARATSG
jgi:hypothetical protein